jgi:hypothetical protein
MAVSGQQREFARRGVHRTGQCGPIQRSTYGRETKRLFVALVALTPKIRLSYTAVDFTVPLPREASVDALD